MANQHVDPQKTARLFGWLFIATFVTAIGAKVLFVNGVGGTFSESRFVPGRSCQQSDAESLILDEYGDRASLGPCEVDGTVLQPPNR